MADENEMLMIDRVVDAGGEWPSQKNIMRKDQKIEALVDILEQRWGRSGALGYLMGLLNGYVPEKKIDFHLASQTEALTKELGL